LIKQKIPVSDREGTWICIHIFQVHTSFPRECHEQSAEAVDLAYRENNPRLTVAGQRLNLTDFAIKPSQLGLLAPLLNSIVKLQSY